jgi:hypothetical protein
MPLRAVQFGAWGYTVSMDDPVAGSDRNQALVRARLIDELTGEPVSLAPVVRPLGSGVTGTHIARALVPRSASGGMVGLVGVPRVAFPALNVQGYAIGLEVDAPGFMRYQAIGALPIQPGFPGSFFPADLGDLQLRRTPVIISGRVTRPVPGGLGPGPNVRVEFTRFWPRIPNAAGVGPPPLPNAVAIPRGLYRDRGIAGATVQRRDFALANPKTLRAEVATGDTTLQLSDRVALVPWSVVTIDDVDPERVEYVPITTVTGAASPQQAATVDLAFPLSRAHHAGAAVQVATPIPGAFAANPLTADARAGDLTVFLGGLTDLGLATTVEVSGGGPPTEYHPVARYDVTSTVPDGYFRLPPLGRSAQVRIVTTPPLAGGFLIVSPDYAGAEFRVDLVVP